MIRKLKILGVLMTAVVVFAAMASSASATFTSAGYPATITGSSTNDVLDAFGSTVKCTNNSFSGVLAEASQTLEMTFSYKNCTAFGLPATVNGTSCNYRFRRNVNPMVTDISCSKAGDFVDVIVYTNAAHTIILCVMAFPAQNSKTGPTPSNGGGGKIVLSGNVSPITATQQRTSIACPAGTHTEAGTYTIQAAGIELSGNNGAISID